MSFSIVTTVYNEYELLRQFVESILYNVDRDSYDQIVIVDDYSKLNSKVRDYEKCLQCTFDFIKVISFPESRYIRYYQMQDMKNKVVNDRFDYRDYDYGKPNMGHLAATQKGIDQTTGTYIFIADVDNIFLKNSKQMLNEIAELFKKHKDVMGIANLVGIKRNDIFEQSERFRLDEPGLHTGGGGYISQCACAIPRDALVNHELCVCPDSRKEDLFEKGAGAVMNYYNKFLFEKGFKTLNYPIYSTKKMLHLGNGHMKRIRKDRPNFGFIRSESRYGCKVGNKLYSWHLGRYYIDLNNIEYKQYLHNKYDYPFTAIQPSISEDLIKCVEVRI